METIKVRDYILTRIDEDTFQGNTSQEGGFEYVTLGNSIDVYEIPLYGGKPQFYRNFKTIEEAVLYCEELC